MPKSKVPDDPPGRDKLKDSERTERGPEESGRGLRRRDFVKLVGSGVARGRGRRT